MIVERNYTVLGMMCAGCVATVERALKNTKGVEYASVNLLEGRSVVRFDDSVTSSQVLQKVIHNIGYELLTDESTHVRDTKRDAIETTALRKLRIKLVVTALLALTMMGIGMWGMSWGIAKEWVLNINLIVSAVILIWSASDYHLRAWRQLRHHTFTMDTLISMSTSVAFVFSFVRYIVLGIPEEGDLFGNSYFDVVGMIVTFVLLGRYIEERAKHRTNEARRQLMSLTPETAIVEKDGNWVECSVAEIGVGDRIRLRQGDRLPVDGTLEAPGAFDESSITGEALPVEKAKGDMVFSGTISVGQATTMSAIKVGDETLLGQVIEAVTNAQASKAPIQRIADKVASIFVPAILLVSLLTLVLWGINGGTDPWLHGIYFAISVLVIACPCALGLATPTAITVAMGKASTIGLLIKDATALEQLGNVTDVIFDKTGTLTEGHPNIVDEYWAEHTPQVEALLVRAEQMSSHPLSSAVSTHYSSLKSDATPTNLMEIPGNGLYFEYHDTAYRIGKEAFTWSAGSPDADRLSHAYPHGTIIYYASDDKLIAVFVIEDKIRADVPKAIDELKEKHHVQVHLLSGDSESRATAFAHEAHISNVKGGLTPLNKQTYIHDLQKAGHVVAMVGDGINDSPALASADLSIAIGSGSDIASEVAQVTTLTGSPYTISNAISLSKRTTNVIRQNFFWAFFYNILAVPIAAGLFYPTLFVNPMIAAAAMAFSSVTVVLNSLRLRK